MKVILFVFVLAAVALTGISCTTLETTNTNYSRPYRKATMGGYYPSSRVDQYSTSGAWDVSQGGGSTDIAFRN
jgi:hypothetical protein